MLAYILRWVASHVRLAKLQCLTIFVMLGICSCGSSKKVEHINKVYKATTANEDISYKAMHRTSLKTGTSTLYEGLQIRHIVYDTSRSDSLGRHPVLSETTINRNRESNKQGGEQNNDKQISARAVTTSEIIDSTAKLYNRLENTETQVPKQIGHVIKWVCIAIGLIIIWNIVRRYGRK